jgi:predicted dehydrogenase
VTVRVIQVGVGDWGLDWSTSILSRSPDAELVAVVDTDPRSLARVDWVPTFTSLGDAVRRVAADAVVVTVDIASHVPVVLAALDAGKHVLVEKPLAPDLMAARVLVEQAERRNLTLAVSQNYRYSIPAQVTMDLVRKRILGAPIGLTVDFRRFRKFDDTQSRAPAFDHSILVQIAIHHVDLMRAILGTEASSVYCRTWNPPPSESVAPAATSAVIDFCDGTVAALHANIVAPGPETAWSGSWRIECTEGDIAWEGPDYERGSAGFVELRPYNGPAQRVPLPELPEDRFGVLRVFAEALKSGEEPSISGRQNLGSIAILSAAFDSARLNKVVPVQI